MSKTNQQIMYQCPSCGHDVPVGAPACPGCHRVFTQEDIGNYSYKIEKERLKYNEKEAERRHDLRIALGGLVAVGVLFIVIQIMGWIGDLKVNNDDRKLESIYSEVQQLILSEKYDEAMLEVLKLQPEKDLDSDHEKKWETRRKETIEFIEQKQKTK